MSASTPSRGRVAAENELLARLGLPPSASPEDVDQLHLAASQFLAAAPASIRGWARAQATQLDEVYLTLTDPVGLEGSALRGPTRPPMVVPGGPATPPARRGPAPAVAAPAAAEPPAEPHPNTAEDEPVAGTVDDTDTDDLDALFASVTPGAHRDMVSGGKADRASTSGAASAIARPTAPAASHLAEPIGSRGPWKTVALGLFGVMAAALILFIGYTVGGGGRLDAAAAGAVASPSAATVDMAQVGALMEKLQANPNDAATLQAIGDTYFAGGDYTSAGSFYDKTLAIDPKNEKALLARGAASFNDGDLQTAEKLWQQVVTLNPKSQEAHYDLGFLYMSQATPDWAKVQTEWSLVVSIDPSTAMAQQVQQHLTALAAKFSASPGPSGAGSSSAPGTSGQPSPAPSGAVTPGSSPATPPAASVVSQTAADMAYGSGTLRAPANTPFTIRFENRDAGIPHDIMIQDASGRTVFKGDLVTGPATVDYQVPALSAGTYTFTCSIHPTTMNGTLAVGG